MLYLLLALLAWRPEGFDKLPPNYTAWDAESTFYHLPLEGQPREVWKSHFPPLNWPVDSTFTAKFALEVPIINSSVQLPFTATLGKLKSWQACGDSLYGMIQFESDTNRDWTVSGKELITVYWAPHDESIREIHNITNRLHPRGDLFEYSYQYHLAVEKSFSEITIQDTKAFRHRGKWWYQGGCSCGAYDFGGSFTTYFVPTAGLDFHITCSSHTWTWDQNPRAGYEGEMPDTLPEEICKSWSDNIRRLERAMERTFRVE